MCGGIGGRGRLNHGVGRGESVPHGGMFVVPLFTHPLLFCLALGIGTVICGVMLSLWKKPVTERDEEFDELSDQKLKDEEITFTLE